MKKITSAFIAIFCIVAFSISLVHAQVPTEESQASPSTTIEYKLPYPGMLPDHALYKLKVLRDKIMLAIIRDPQTKAQYHLNLANKQILMSQLMAEKGKVALAEETALKGENQITQLTFVYKNANIKPFANFYNELKLATQKHQEILKNIADKLSGKEKTAFETVIGFSKRNAEEIDVIYSSTE